MTVRAGHQEIRELSSDDESDSVTVDAVISRAISEDVILALTGSSSPSEYFDPESNVDMVVEESMSDLENPSKLHQTLFDTYTDKQK